MGRYSSDSEEDRSRSSRRRRSRSRSPRSRKKSRRKSRSRSRSRRHSSSSDRRRPRRSRSRSHEKRHKRHRRSKSRSRSRERRHRGHKGKRSRSSSPSKDKRSKEDKKIGMPNPEQVKIKMEKALEAATAGDSSLQDKVVKAEKAEPSSAVDPVRQEAIRKMMEQDSFTPAQFLSSRSKKPSTDPLQNEKEAKKIAESLSGAISSLGVSMNEKIIYKESGSVASHSLFLSQEEKETRWLERLQELRQRAAAKSRLLP